MSQPTANAVPLPVSSIRKRCFFILSREIIESRGGFSEFFQVLDHPRGTYQYIVQRVERSESGIRHIFAEFKEAFLADSFMNILSCHVGGDESLQVKVCLTEKYTRYVVCPPGFLPWFYAADKSLVQGDFCLAE
jgi:hypothetical protein